jgi:hypothetical protein
MTALLPYIEFEVRAAEAVSLDRLAGWTVVALGTRIWLTEEKGGRDIWLLPGDRHRIAGAGRVVVEAWPAAGADADLPAKIRLAPPIARSLRLALCASRRSHDAPLRDSL